MRNRSISSKIVPNQYHFSCDLSNPYLDHCVMHSHSIYDEISDYVNIHLTLEQARRNIEKPQTFRIAYITTTTTEDCIADAIVLCWIIERELDIIYVPHSLDAASQAHARWNKPTQHIDIRDLYRETVYDNIT